MNQRIYCWNVLKSLTSFPHLSRILPFLFLFAMNNIAWAGPSAVIIMGAGQGTRMNSDLPKVLQKVHDQTMISHILTQIHSTDPSASVARLQQ